MGRQKRREKLSSECLRKGHVGMMGRDAKEAGTPWRLKVKGLVSRAEKCESHHSLLEGLGAFDVARFTLEAHHATSILENALEGDEAGDKEVITELPHWSKKSR